MADARRRRRRVPGPEKAGRSERWQRAAQRGGRPRAPWWASDTALVLASVALLLLIIPFAVAIVVAEERGDGRPAAICAGLLLTVVAWLFMAGIRRGARPARWFTMADPSPATFIVPLFRILLPLGLIAYVVYLALTTA